MHFQIIEKRKIWYIVSGLLATLSVVAVSLWGLKLGIDFTGGTLMEVSFLENRPSIESIQNELSGLDLGDITVQPAGSNDIILRLRNVTETEHQEVLAALKKSSNSTEESIDKVLQENRF